MWHSHIIHDVTYYRSLLQKSPIKETEMNRFIYIHALCGALIHDLTRMTFIFFFFDGYCSIFFLMGTAALYRVCSTGLR